MIEKPNSRSFNQETIKTSIKSPEEIKKVIREQELFHLNLGYIVELFSNSKYHVKCPIDYFIASVVPALRYNQFKIFFSGFRPVAYVSWAKLSSEIENKFKNGDYFLKMEEWQSGDNIWLVEFISSDSNLDYEQLMKKLKEKVFAEKVINVVTKNENV